MSLRKVIYKIELQYENPPDIVPITIATLDKSKLPELIEKNRRWFEQKIVPDEENGVIKPKLVTNKIIRWRFVDELLPFQKSEEEYEQIIADCDIVDEVE